METFKLSSVAIVLGMVFGIPHIYGVLRPAAYGQMMRRFPRYTPLGYILILLATAWFLSNLQLEAVSDFANFKPFLFALFALVGVGTCLFVKDFLPVRGLAVLLLLLGKTMVDSARWIDTGWRLVIVTWAYLWILAGMWLTISPWRLRDLIEWSTASEQRVRWLSAARLAFGLFVLLLGLTVYRGAEAKASPSHNEYNEIGDR